MCEALNNYAKAYREEGKNEGIEVGKELGIKEGKIESVMKLVTKKYKHQDLSWIETCPLHQLDTILEFIMEDMTYDEFYQHVIA